MIPDVVSNNFLHAFNPQKVSILTENHFSGYKVLFFTFFFLHFKIPVKIELGYLMDRNQVSRSKKIRHSYLKFFFFC